MEELGGVLLTYSNIKYVESKGKILYETPQLLCKAIVKTTCFCPKVGNLIEGKVMQVASDFIGLHLFGIFNGSILSNSIPNSFTYDAENQIYLHNTSNQTIKLGDKIKFKIKE